jgi:TonB family protein
MNQRNLDLSHRLIHYAAHRAPQSLSERLEEEWLSDMAQRSSSLSRLSFAIGCCWATRVIAYQHQPASVVLSGTVLDARVLMTYAHSNLGYFSRRSSTFFLIMLLHAALFYGLMTALTYKPANLIPPPLVNRALDTLPAHEPLPTPPGPQLSDTTIEVSPPPVVRINDSDPNTDVTTKIGEAPPLPIPPTSLPSHVVREVQGGPAAGFPNTDDFYPDAAKRLGEQSAATVKVCVDTSGRLTSAPLTLEGTGSWRLDEGALKLARAGSGHYRASTQDGSPVASCYPLRIRFQLRN